MAPHTLEYLDEDSHAVSEAAYIFKNGNAFASLDKNGGINRAVSATGLYTNDTQYIGTWQTTLPGQSLKLLSREDTEEKTDLHIRSASDTMQVDRTVLVADDRMQEMLTITNTGDREIKTSVEFTFGTSFTDIFAIRGDKNLRTGPITASVNDSSVKFSHEGLTRDDGVTHVRHCDFSFSLPPEKIEMSDDGNTYIATFSLALPPDCAQSLVLVGGKPLEETLHPSEPFFRAVLAKSRADFWEIFHTGAWIESNAPEFNTVLQTAQKDMALLITKLETGLYPFAGLPWFGTTFGRDALVVSLQLMELKPDVARGTLTLQGKNQATKNDPSIAAQIGKIFHERRGGESSESGQNRFENYYGGVDTTLLYIRTHLEYFKRTNDAEFLKQEWPHIEMAINWMIEYGDPDKDGLIKHIIPADRSGLTVQSWMDSGDAMNNEKGELPDGPLAICEVQGHAYAAYRAAAEMAETLGLKADAELYQSHADLTKKAFDEKFWSPQLGTYLRALDGDQPCLVKGSNPGQLLDTGIIATREKTDAVVRTLMAQDSFSGWGLRTRAQGQACSNDIAYHNGSVWPHDTAIAVKGMFLTHPDEAYKTMKALVDAACGFPGHRLPELFSGAARGDGSKPDDYPAACCPHAWSSAAPIQMLVAALGMTVDPIAGEVKVKRRNLPEWMGTITVHNLQAGDKTLSLTVNPPDDEKKMTVAPDLKPA
ncbi:MAG: amylo-alpha,6-glucosidase [Micavibrio sp.]|nr:amylo-alpha,6-glucosidase [Micavibrio sp.]